jgi:hypothetical protein
LKSQRKRALEKNRAQSHGNRQKYRRLTHRLGRIYTHKSNRPPVSSGRRWLHKSETRISAIADFAAESKQKKKALPLFPQYDRNVPAGHAEQ